MITLRNIKEASSPTAPSIACKVLPGCYDGLTRVSQWLSLRTSISVGPHGSDAVMQRF